jgi:hypothetical protein
MSKKGKKIAKAAAALTAAYLGSKALGSKMDQMDRARGIGTSMDTDTEFKGQVSNLTKKGMKRVMEDAPKKSTKMQPGASMPYKSLSEMFGFKSGGSVVTKGQGKVMKPKKTILLT